MIDEFKDDVIDMLIQYAIIGTVSVACIGAVKLLKSTKNKVTNKISKKRRII